MDGGGGGGIALPLPPPVAPRLLTEVTAWKYKRLTDKLSTSRKSTNASERAWTIFAFIRSKTSISFNVWVGTYEFCLHNMTCLSVTLLHLYIQCSFPLIPGCPKKAKRRIFSTLRTENVIYFFTSLYNALSEEENDTKIIKFGCVILILCQFFERQSFSNFAWYLRPISEELCREKPSIWCFVETHWSVFLLLPQINGLPQTPYGRLFPTQYSSLIGRKNQAKFENDCISRSACWA